MTTIRDFHHPILLVVFFVSMYHWRQCRQPIHDGRRRDRSLRLLLLPKTMLRRLIRRFSEEGGGREGQAQTNGGGCGDGGGISHKAVEEIELDIDSEEVR